MTNEEKQKVEDNLALVNYLIKKYMFAANGNYDDYFQAGAYGLCLAVKRFDENKGVEFSTFASRYIAGHMLRYYRDFAQGPIKPVRIAATSKQRKPTYLYIDGLINEETGDCYGYELIDKGASNEDDILIDLLTSELETMLTEREKVIVKLALRGATQNEIANKINVSQAQVSRTKKNLKNKIISVLRS